MRPISTLDLLGLQCQMTPQLSGEISVDTPELPSVHCIKMNDLQHVYCKQVGQ